MRGKMRRVVASIARKVLIGSLVVSVSGVPVVTPVSAQTTEPATQIYLPEIRQPVQEADPEKNDELGQVDAAQSSGSQQIDISQVKPASEPLDLNVYGSAQQWRPSISLDPPQVDAVEAATLGDEVRWLNSEVELCYIPLGVALLVNTALSYGLPPFFDAVPTVAATVANVALKFCGPHLTAPKPAFASPTYLLPEPDPRTTLPTIPQPPKIKVAMQTFISRLQRGPMGIYLGFPLACLLGAVGGEWQARCLPLQYLGGCDVAA